jgi:hypothetical protein
MLKSYIEKINKSQILYAYWFKNNNKLRGYFRPYYLQAENALLAIEHETFVVIFIQYWRTQKRTTCKKAFAGSRTTHIEIV